MCSKLVTQEQYVNLGVSYDELPMCNVFAVTSFLDTEHLLICVMVEFLYYYSSCSPLSQHAYLPRRSSGEFIWTLQFVRSIAERFGERFVLLQTDLEKAFDSFNRSKLMAILEESGCCSEDDLRIIQFLLADTKLRARVEGQLGPIFCHSLWDPSRRRALSTTVYHLFCLYT